jgi:serine 3-dehydrogenase
MEDGRGHIVNLGSWAGREAYPLGGMYVGSKTAVLALTRVMRRELVGRIKVSTVDPGMVGGTEFSDVRFRGDQERKDAVYRGVDYLTLPTWLIASSSRDPARLHGRPTRW